MSVHIYNDDCLDRLRLIEQKVNLVVVDLPYGQTDCAWDSVIDLSKMWDCLKPICTNNCIYVFFCTTKFGYSLINSNPKWFRYDLVWEKSRATGYLSANRAPLRKHEMIYIFSRPGGVCEDNHNAGLRTYAQKIKDLTGYSSRVIDDIIGEHRARRFFSIKSKQFALPPEQTYNVLIDKFKLDDMDGFRTYKSLTDEWVDQKKKIYNPQKTPGKPWTHKGYSIKPNVYGKTHVSTIENKTGDRHPISILKFNSPIRSLHRTQKPVDICEWLIKSYSNPGDTVLDFTMGSGTTGIACLNTDRHFIGIEKDLGIFRTARNRLIEHELKK